MKKVGITGPPGSGKSTLWRAITGTATSGEIAAVDVPDQRLDVLCEIHSSRSRVAAKLEVIDAHLAGKTQAAAFARLREMDALLVVAPAFGGLEASKALESFLEELVLADLGPIENRLARARKDPASRGELPALEKALERLSGGELLKDHEWEPDELATFSPIAPLTLKPLTVIWNVDEASTGEPPPDVSRESFAVNAALEAEVAGMDADEAAALLGAYGVGEPVLERVIRSIYENLDLITFLTTSDKESRAWEVRRGATAPQAAGVIHSDLQRGFIRAEVIAYEALVAAGSWDKARSAGKLRVEGKDYVFKEGDVVHFRFAV